MPLRGGAPYRRGALMDVVEDLADDDGIRHVGEPRSLGRLAHRHSLQTIELVLLAYPQGVCPEPMGQRQLGEGQARLPMRPATR